MNLTITEEKKLSRPDILFSLARVPDSSRVFYGSSDGGVYHVDLAAEKPEPAALEGPHRHRPGGYITGLALADGGRRLISGAYDRQLIWWDTATLQPVHSVPEAHGKWIRKVVASPDGKIVASVADDMVCRLWDGLTGKPLGELQGHEAETPHQYPSMLFTCAFNASGCPAMSVPFGLLASGLPVGVHLGAGFGQDELLFSLAGQIERAAPWAHLRPRDHAETR